MITLRTGRSSERPSTTKPTPLPRPIAGLPLWSSDGVLWGVVRMEGCFDVGDTARHAGIVQHAYPLGRDWLAACGFQTPLQRAFDGVRRPLLAMPGAHNPRCASCAALIVPAVEPVGPIEGTAADPNGWILRRLDPPAAPAGPAADPRPLRPAVVIPVVGVSAAPAPAAPAPAAARGAWPSNDQAPAPEPDRLRVIEVWRRAGRPGDETPAADARVETAGPVGRRAFMEVDRADKIWG